MKKLTWVLAILLTGPAFGQEVATVKSVRGDVAIKPAAGGDFKPAKPGQTLAIGDFLSTDVESEAVLAFPQGADVKLFELSQVRINEAFLSPDRNKLQLFLRTGKVETLTTKPLARTDFSVQTPVATASIRGSHQIVGHGAGFGTSVTFLSGVGFTRNSRGLSVDQSAGSKSSVDRDGNLRGPESTARTMATADLSPSGRDEGERQAAQNSTSVGDRQSGDSSSPAGITSALGTTGGSAHLRLTFETVPKQ